MTKHSEELQEAAVIAEKKIVKISLPASQLLAEKVISTFCSSSYRYPIWENLISYIGVTFPYSWDWFASLLSNKEVILFFEPTENDFAYVIINGAEIPDILNNSYRFTFYITDSESSFLFCYNRVTIA